MKKPVVVVMVRGGVVQEVMSDSRDIDVLVLDHDVEEVSNGMEVEFKDASGEEFLAVPNTHLTVCNEAKRYFDQYKKSKFSIKK